MKKRILWIDITRIVSIWFIIELHACAFDLDKLIMWSPRYRECYTWGLFGHFGVPMFVMLSGALLLDHEPDIKKIYTKKIPKLVGAKLINMLAYFAVSLAVCIYVSNLDMSTVFYPVLHEDGATYFLALLGGCYMLSPLVYTFCKNDKLERYFLILSIVFSMILPLLGALPVVGDIFTYIHVQTRMSFVHGILFYFVLGHYLLHHLDRVSKGTAFAGLIGAIILCIVIVWNNTFNMPVEIQYALMSTTYDDYMNLIAMIYAVAVFVFLATIFRDIKVNDRIENLIHHMGRNVMAIYILHFPLLYGLQEAHISPNVFKCYSLGVIVESSAIFIMLYLISLIWERIPVLKRVIN